MSTSPVAVLLAAGAALWERAALELLDRPGRSVVVKRCLDLHDLLATAATGGADVAVLAEGLPGLDADSVDRLSRHGVRAVVVTDREAAPGVRARLARLGVAAVADAGALDRLGAQVLEVSASAQPATPAPEPAPGRDDRAGLGRLVAVWGPHGAPGRTTVAVALAAEAAAAGVRTMLVDADPYGGAAAHHLAVLDEVSGLLGAARAANAGELDAGRLGLLSREVAPRLRLLTGLPRPDRWTEVRPQAFEELLAAARRLDELVVVDCGPGLPEAADAPFADGPGRDAMTGAGVTGADLVVAVGGADPVALTRLARSLPELAELRAGLPTVVVVNRMRPSLGWSRTDVTELLGSVAPGAPVRFLPDDRAAADRALVRGRSLLECGESALRSALAGVAGDVLRLVGLERRSAAHRGRPRSEPRPRVDRSAGGRGRRAARRGRRARTAAGAQTVSSR